MQMIVAVALDSFMAVGPVVGYIYQYRLIHVHQQVGAFSIDICGIILLANILRTQFYLFTPYQTALLIQSLLMITMQLFLLRLVCHHRNPQPITFWRWPHFHTYILCILSLSLVTFALTYIFLTLQCELYGQALGLVALLSQSVLILPQIVEICRIKTSRGVSRVLLGLNFAGDIGKIAYFIFKEQPFQFKLCGAIQLTLDSLVLLQTVIYPSKNMPEETPTATPVKTEQISPRDHESPKWETDMLPFQLVSPVPSIEQLGDIVLEEKQWGETDGKHKQNRFQDELGQSPQKQNQSQRRTQVTDAGPQ